jgi:phosphoribosyl 1,2-cyclic phosphodiesterase
VDIGGNNLLVLDAGTGIHSLGMTLTERTTDIFVLLSHSHWDHIQGFPFFDPLYQPHSAIYLLPSPLGQSNWCAALEQMDGKHFPVTPDALPSHTQCITRDAVDFLHQHGFCVTPIAANHPGGATGYRIEHADRSIVYLTDNELEPPYGKVTSFESFVHFCSQADVLIHDAQYLRQDMPHKHGWGHSLVSQACALAIAAEVKHLVLFHHDPERTDDDLDTIQDMACSWIYNLDQFIQCTVAYEGLVLVL